MKIIDMLKSIGRYQWFLIWFFAGYNFVQWGNYGILILAPDIDFKCKDFNSTDSQCSLSLEPAMQAGLPTVPDNGSYNISGESEIKCENFEYDHSKFEWTLTERFNLVCDRKYIISIMKSVYIAGYFLGAIGSGIVADKFGRRFTVLLCSAVGLVVSIIQAFLPNVWAFIAFRFLHAIFDMACYLSLYILVTESIHKEQRIIPKYVDSTFYDICTAVLGAVSFVISNYAHFYMLFAIMFVVVFLFAFFSYESPRWLSAKRREDRAKKIIGKISKVNGVEDTDVMFLLHSNENPSKGSVLDLFKTPLIRKRTILLCCVWFVFVFGYYAITLNLGDFSDDVRISLLISGSIEVITALPVALLVKKLGRTAVLFAILICAGICCLGMAPIVEDRSHPALLALALTGKLMLSNTFFIMYVYTPELYPTIIRGSGLGLCSTSSRVVSALAPQLSLLNAYWPPFMVVTLGILLVLVAFLVPILPDTSEVEMPQTIAEGENLFKNHWYSLRKAHVEEPTSES